MYFVLTIQTDYQETTTKICPTDSMPACHRSFWVPVMKQPVHARRQAVSTESRQSGWQASWQAASRNGEKIQLLLLLRTCCREGSLLSRGSYCLIKACQRCENWTQFWTPDISPHNRERRCHKSKKKKLESWSRSVAAWRHAVSSRAWLLALPPSMPAFTIAVQPDYQCNRVVPHMYAAASLPNHPLQSTMEGLDMQICVKTCLPW